MRFLTTLIVLGGLGYGLGGLGGFGFGGLGGYGLGGLGLGYGKFCC